VVVRPLREGPDCELTYSALNRGQEQGLLEITGAVVVAPGIAQVTVIPLSAKPASCAWYSPKECASW
jgi:hypothetical protein